MEDYENEIRRFGLFVDDMAKMIRFYKDVLGFEINGLNGHSGISLMKRRT